jgi:acyl-CoA thioesterase-1
MSSGPLRFTWIWVVMALVAAIGCGPHEALQAERSVAAASEAQAVGSTPAAVNRAGQPAAGARPRVVGARRQLDQAWPAPEPGAYPALLQQRLTAEGFNYEVANAAAGRYSAGGLSRLDWSLDGDVRVLIVALGGNDGLRGLPVQQLKQNLSQIIERARARRITVMLAGMEAPPNHGWEYVVDFHQVFADLAKKYQVPFVPFLLQGGAGHDDLNQRDGIHPTAQGARIVADNVWTVLKPIVEEQPRQPTRGPGCGLPDHDRVAGCVQNGR